MADGRQLLMPPRRQEGPAHSARGASGRKRAALQPRLVGMGMGPRPGGLQASQTRDQPARERRLLGHNCVTIARQHDAAPGRLRWKTVCRLRREDICNHRVSAPVPGEPQKDGQAHCSDTPPCLHPDRKQQGTGSQVGPAQGRARVQTALCRGVGLGEAWALYVGQLIEVRRDACVWLCPAHLTKMLQNWELHVRHSTE